MPLGPSWSASSVAVSPGYQLWASRDDIRHGTLNPYKCSPICDTSRKIELTNQGYC